jgi:hypothetical protein
MISRLPPKERRAMLEAMDKCRRKRRVGEKGRVNSLTSGDESKTSDIVTFSNSEDWRNWMRLHEDEEVTLNDVCRVGNRIGVPINGEKNIFLETISNIERRVRGGKEVGRSGKGTCI